MFWTASVQRFLLINEARDFSLGKRDLALDIIVGFWKKCYYFGSPHLEFRIEEVVLSLIKLLSQLAPALS